MSKISVVQIPLKRGIAFILIAMLLVAMSAYAKRSGAYSVYYNVSTTKTPIYSVDTAEKKVSISFDCAWGVEKTDGLIEVMDFFGVECTFFMTEFWVKKYPDYVKKICESGHEAGTHSATHPHMSSLDKAAIERELTTSSEAIESLTGEKVILFRPPFGDYNDLLLKTCAEKGLYAIQWDVDSLDWKDLSAREIADRIISRVKNGSIILCHNNAKHTLEALPLVFSTLQNRGFKFVKISELIYKENYVIDGTGKQIQQN